MSATTASGAGKIVVRFASYARTQAALSHFNRSSSGKYCSIERFECSAIVDATLGCMAIVPESSDSGGHLKQHGNMELTAASLRRGIGTIGIFVAKAGDSAQFKEMA